MDHPDAVPLAATSFAYLRIDPAGTIAAWGAGAAALLGWPAAEALGRHVGLIYRPEDRRRGQPEEDMRRAAGTGRAAIHRWHHRRDGTRWCAIGEMIALAPLGAGKGFALFLRDGSADQQAADLQLVTDAMPVLISFVDEDHVYRFANRRYETWFAQSSGSIVGHHVRDIIGEATYADRLPRLARALAGEHVSFDAMVPSEGGVLRECHIEYIPRRQEDGRVDGFHVMIMDITDRKAAEARLVELNETLEARVAARTADLREAHEALRQAQKMEALGQLTGGIAHDFNNLLQGIVGSLDLLRRRLGQGRTGDVEPLVDGALGSAHRAASLTHRLLAFSRRQPLDPKPVGVNPLLAAMEDLLRRTLGENVVLSIEPAEGLWPTLCDRNQLESAVLNVAINARDAMPEGGWLTIRTANVEVGTRAAGTPREVAPGAYVTIAVTDTGTGMTPEVKERAFDPFFTTKPPGEGTGLGLSMIYGFARQSGGAATIESEVGRGTTVTIWLPRHSGQGTAGDERPAAAATHAARPGETVLVLEDEDVVRGLITEMLRDLGYDALEAPRGERALALLKQDRRIDLLVTDVGLPGPSGRSVAEAARQMRPGLKVLFMTGYGNDAEAESTDGTAAITKPFALEALASRIRQLLDRGQP